MPVIYQSISSVFPIRRDAPATASSDTTAPPTQYLLIAAVNLIIVGVLLLAGVAILRRVRQNRRLAAAEAGSGWYNRRNGNRCGLTIHTTDKLGRSNLVFSSLQTHPMLANPDLPPASVENVPAIHITFPDEKTAEGRRSSSRVVIVRMGDQSVGLEPLLEADEKSNRLPPAYEDDGSAQQFFSVDMKSVGGLVEKERHGSR